MLFNFSPDRLERIFAAEILHPLRINPQQPRRSRLASFHSPKRRVEQRYFKHPDLLVEIGALLRQQDRFLRRETLGQNARRQVA